MLLRDMFGDLSPAAQSRLNLCLLSIISEYRCLVNYVTQTEIATEKDLLVSLTFHNFSAEMLKEFAQKIVKPYFNGNMNKAIRSLMESAIHEERIVNHSILKAT